MAAARPKAKAAVEQIFMDHQSSEKCGGVMEAGCDKLVSKTPTLATYLNVDQLGCYLPQ